MASGLAVALALPLVVASTSAAAPLGSSSTVTTASPATSTSVTPTAPAAVPGGPRPTDIRLSDDDRRTTVLVHGLGSVAAARERENRSYRHSDLQPTARFAAQGDELTISSCRPTARPSARSPHPTSGSSSDSAGSTTPSCPPPSPIPTARAR